MLQDKVFIVKLAAVDGLAPGAVVVGEVAALAHKLRDDAMEAAALVAKAFLVCAQAAEVLYRLHGEGRGWMWFDQPGKLQIPTSISTHRYTPAVMGTMSARSRKRSLPAGLFPILMSM